ncbi:MAG: glycosyltransferase family 4 protein [Elusimicrobiota bacterium]
MDKIRVYHIITKLELGGAQGNTLHTVKYLNRDKFEPGLVCGPGGILDEEAKTVPNLYLHFVPSLIREIHPLKDISALFELYKVLKKNMPVVVHTHSSKAGILGRIAAWVAGVPVIVHTYHGFGFHDFQNPIVKVLYVLIEKFTSGFTDKLVTVAKDNIEKALSSGIGKREQYAVIRSGIPVGKYKGIVVDVIEEKKKLGLKPEDRVVTTIGPFKPQKNLVDMIKSAKLASEKVGNIKYLFIGDGEQRGMIESLIAELKLENTVKLLGWRKDVGQLLKITDVFAMSSLWEGLPRSILEAMACAKPVVAYAVDGVKEIVIPDKTGYLIEPKDYRTLAEKVVYLIQNNELAQQYGTAGSELINREYDIDYMVIQQEELYTDLVRQKWNTK